MLFSLLLLSFSFVTVILKVLGLKKPAFERLFSQMTAHFVSTVFKNSVRYIYCDNCLSLIGLFLFSEGD